MLRDKLTQYFGRKDEGLTFDKLEQHGREGRYLAMRESSSDMLTSWSMKYARMYWKMEVDSVNSKVENDEENYRIIQGMIVDFMTSHNWDFGRVGDDQSSWLLPGTIMTFDKENMQLLKETDTSAV